MQDPEKTPKGDDGDDESSRLFPVGFFNITCDYQKQNIQPNDSEKKQQVIERLQEESTKTIGQKFQSWHQAWVVTPDRVLELLFTLAIVFFAGVQWRTAVSNGDTTTRQTEQLISAAKYGAYASSQNAFAAQSFADSARRINNGISNAVDRLNTQAQATSDIASATAMQVGSAHAAVEVARYAMYVEQRPWVGIEIVQTDTPPKIIELAPNATTRPYTVAFVAHNSGRTPAVKFHSECCEYLDQVEPGAPIPPLDYDALRADIDRHFFAWQRALWKTDPGREAQDRESYIKDRDDRERKAAQDEQQVFAPDEKRFLQNFITSGPDDHKYHFILGRFIYRDVLDPSREHVTTYCLVHFGNSPLTLCPKGQDMN